ncbi:hypothetical protein F4778DRAFT_781048 [Xylariomycetidae sp. FL2044]|nr:hypothetical protein F4778DRAFT_781048 [Xylariomycetidae sp. FL2044]
MSSNFTGTLGSSGGLHLPSWALDLRYPFHGVRQVAPPTILHQFRFLNPDDNHRTLIAVGFRVGILSDELVTLPPAETEDNLSVPGSLTVKCDFEADDVTTDTLARCDFDKRLYDIVRKIPPSMHDQEIGQLLELFSRPENIIVPPEYQAGDYLVAIDWVDEPQVLRPVSSATQRPEFEYIGPARRIPQREDLHLLDLFIRHGWAEHALPLGGPERYDSWHLELETFVLV